MAANSWTREDNARFKNALTIYCAFSPVRFQRIAEYVQKPVVNVKEHYEEMVDDLLEIGSAHMLAANLTEEMVQSLNQVERTVWNKEEHEWFLIGLKRFERDWGRIADFLNSKNQMQVVIYAHNYYHWQNSMKNVMNRSRANTITMNPTGQQGSLAHPQLQQQPQEHLLVLDIGRNARASSSRSSRPWDLYNNHI